MGRVGGVQSPVSTSQSSSPGPRWDPSTLTLFDQVWTEPTDHHACPSGPVGTPDEVPVRIPTRPTEPAPSTQKRGLSPPTHRFRLGLRQWIVVNTSFLTCLTCVRDSNAGLRLSPVYTTTVSGGTWVWVYDGQGLEVLQHSSRTRQDVKEHRPAPTTTSSTTGSHSRAFEDGRARPHLSLRQVSGQS